jgi:hypothetical protein
MRIHALKTLKNFWVNYPDSEPNLRYSMVKLRVIIILRLSLLLQTSKTPTMLEMRELSLIFVGINIDLLLRLTMIFNFVLSSS